MNEYKQAQLEPFKPHQCMHWNTDGIRCRAYARHNEYTCFHHRHPDEPSIPVVANDPFTLPSLKTRDGMFEALDVIATHLAGKTIDDRRANLLLYTVQLASHQHPRPLALQPAVLEPAQSQSKGSTAPTQEISPEQAPVPEPFREEQPAATEPEAQPEEREYTAVERWYLSFVSELGHAPTATKRPASLTAEEVDAYAARCRAMVRTAIDTTCTPEPGKEPAPATDDAEQTTDNGELTTDNGEQTTDPIVLPTLNAAAAPLEPRTSNLYHGLMKLITTLLVPALALAQIAATAQTPAPAKPHAAAATHTAAAAAPAAKAGCVKLPTLSPKIPALPAGMTCAKPLYTLTLTPPVKVDFVSPLEGTALKDVLGLDSGTSFSLSYIDTKVGTGELAAPKKWYSILYHGYLVDGTEFDSTEKHGGTPFAFPYGAHQVVAGWDTGFAGMHVGGKRRIFIPSQLGYGPKGNGAVPANAMLIFDVEFISQSDSDPTPKAPSAAAPTPPAAQPAPAAAPATPPSATPPPAAQPAPAPATPPAATAPKPQ